MFWFLIIALIISMFWVIVGILLYILPLFFGAPYEGSGRKKVADIIKISKIKKGEKVVDLGSGDGRIVIAFAKQGITAHGYEINPLLVLISKFKTRRIKNAKIYWKNFWKVDLGDYDIIVLFQYGTIMKKLEEKLKKEIKKSAKIISYHWKFPNLKIKEKIRDIYLYSPESKNL